LRSSAGNGGAALIGVVLPGRFDDAMRIAVVRRYPGCPAGLRAISLSLVMLGLIDSAALAPLAAVAVAFPGAGIAARAALAVVAGAGIAAAAVIVALPRLAGSERALRFRLGRWLSPRTTSLLPRNAGVGVRLRLLARPRGGVLHHARHARDWVTRSRSRCCFSAPVPQAAALPVGPAGAATQAGAGTAALAPRVSEHRRRLLPLSRWAPWAYSPEQQVLLFAIAWRTGRLLLPARPAT
jgi:hypothetical protein